ncbi:hypothetical protein N665_0218s0104 [Sinapis alba]|nr:hypothetical protein N665_0218s0104 [Sinapis alba]
MPVTLTINTIATINAGDVNLKPLLQILDIRLIGKTQERGQERYHLLISEGVSAQHTMLAVQLNDRGQDSCDGIYVIPLPCPGNIHHLSRVGLVEQHSTNKAPPRGVNITPSVQPSYQPPPSYINHGPIMKNEAPARIISIAALTPYQGWWAIKSRATAKEDIRHYNNAKGDGKVFSFDLLVSDGVEIRVTCINAVVDRFYDVIEVGKVYFISNGSFKPAQKNFNHLKNEWEIFLESVSTRNGMETHQRTLNLMDDSGKAVVVTLWGEFCNRDGRELEEMVGKSLGKISSTHLFINPDFPEAQKLRNWFDHGGKDTASSSIFRDNMPGGGSKNEIRKVVSRIKEEGLGRSDKPDWVTVKVKATIAFIKTDSSCYTTCPLMIGDKQCNKKEFIVIVRNILFHQYKLKLKIKEETYAEEHILKMTVVMVDKGNYTSDSRYLLNLLVGCLHV